MRRHSLIYRAFGHPLDQLTLDETELPPAPEALTVAMSFAPVNPSDLIPITGAYAHRITPPLAAGYEGVGRVIAAPPTQKALIGQRILPLRGEGTWQTHLHADPALAIPVPDDIPDTTAARAYINPLAALSMLDLWPVAGRHVLLSGAGSSCADYLGLWALARGAASVTGLYRSASRVPRLHALGITPAAQSDTAAVLNAARRADLVFDALGGPVATVVLETLHPEATLIGYGLLTGQPLRPAGPVRARHARFHLRDSLAPLSPADWQTRFARLWPLLRAAPLPETAQFALTDWRAAVTEASRPGGRKPLLRLS